MKIKYPRTYHLPYSEKCFSDDKRCANDNHLIGRDVIGTIKLDGENTTITSEYSHARSMDSVVDSEDRRWIEALRILKIQGKIPSTMRICGENVFYKHTCEYKNLRTMFYVHSIWDGNVCLSYDETMQWCSRLGLVHVPVFFISEYNREHILLSFQDYKARTTKGDVEGFVIRLADSFELENFSTSLNKFVCSDFELPSEHWRNAPKVLNNLYNNMNPWQLL